MQTLPDALASYVPVLVTRRLAEDPRPLTTPCSESFPAAVLCADISGFTAFTERLAREGPAGVEKVGAGLDGYFGRLTEIIAQHGGDVVKFAGDAVTAIWTLPPRDRTRDLQRVALPAIACGMAIQSALHGYRFTDGVELSLRVGLGASRIAAVHVGGLAGRWEVVLTGSALAQGLKAEALARPGEVVVAPQLWPLIAGHVRGEPAGAGFVRVHEIAGTITCTPLLRPAMPAEAEAALCGYVPVAVATRLAAGQRSWLAELRRVAVVFLHLPAVTYQTPLDEAQQVMVAVQQIVDSAEGSINHVSVNNDGATVLIAFGLPPLAHEDDAVRAVGAAQQLRDVLGRLACPPRIGLVTGRAFCGSVGGADRCEYTLLGDVVNLAARLMQAADEARPILCDSHTFASARAQFMFEAYPPIKVKGKTEAVAIYGPASGRLVARGGRLVARGPSSGTQTADRRHAPPRPALVGRMRERVVLIGKLHELLRGRSATVVVEGEAGLGKSRLADDLLEQAEAMGVPQLIGAREAPDGAAPYHAWTPVFRPIFGLDDPEAERDPWGRVQTVLKDLVPGSGARAPLLAAVLALDPAETERSAAIAGKVRAELTRELLVAVLRGHLEDGPALLLIEDAHWVDSASWALLAQVREQIGPLLCVLVTGPIESDTDPAPSELRQVLADASTHHLVLGPLSLAETETLVCRKLGVARAPAEVIEFVYGRAEGHPLFTEELSVALRDAGLLSILGDECYLAPEAGELKAAQFPDNLEAVITTRIDRLSPQLQLVVKVASVLGRVFPLSLLRAVHPIEADRAGLPEHLAALERRGMVLLKGGSVADPSYGFKHALTQEVAYNLLPFAQRQQLHQAIAEYHERVYKDRVELHYPLLAHHWYSVVAPTALVTEAQRPGPELVQRAVGYLQRAGEQAIRNGVGQEAALHFGRAIELLPGLPASSARTEQEIALQIGLGNAIIAARGVASDEVERTFARARELCREVGETRHLFPVLFGLWTYYFVRSEHRVAIELAEQLLVFAERRKERVPLLIAHRTLGTQMLHLGELPRARAHLERAIALYAPDFDRPLAFLYNHDPRVASLSLLAICLYLQGNRAEAEERCKVALAVARELGNPATAAFAIAHAAILCQLTGQVERAREQAQAQMLLGGQEHVAGTWHSFAQVVEAWSMAAQGQLEEATDLLRQAIVDLQVAGMSVFWPWVLGVYAELCEHAGRGDEALAHLHEALAASRQSGARVWESALLRRRGELLLAMSGSADGDTREGTREGTPEDTREATLGATPEGTPEACFVAAIHRAREQHARLFELRAALRLAGLPGRSPASQALLEETRARLAGKLDDPALAQLGAPAGSGLVSSGQ
ncbi:MAG: AAA family ATPase [Nannocystis sp.]|uniref:adenylate/guanylate cyclase domain-containing protein n=1 Tax=Nannocystis sp. TaxID=1962667 RepID=UPI002427EF69|nr:adenylate/guanylate cyclase domain-containing protein [Nannocystis sp.]MBK9755245.1 AAA family ATPase [Nannocystis sp.]